jgi:hypothetical protein
VPLLAFIDSIDLDKSIEKKMLPCNGTNSQQTKKYPVGIKKKRGFHL